VSLANKSSSEGKLVFAELGKYVTEKKKFLRSSTGSVLWLDLSGSSSQFLRGEMGDTATFAVHRCRFVDFTPSAITAITFPPLRLPSAKGKSPEVRNQPLKFGIFAVGRANGNIELCEWTGGDRQPQAPQAWVVHKVCVLVQILASRGL
jgi:hypothetical protein